LLVAVLIAAALLRIGVSMAYGPALFFSDSWAYIDAVYAGEPVGFRGDRPSGYPLVLVLLWAFGADLSLVTVVQHVAGLVTGVLVYLFVTRLGVPRSLGAVAAGVVLFDAYALALEQHVMPEALFTLALMGALILASLRPVTAWRLAAMGALLVS
jgi:hypothetical protein